MSKIVSKNYSKRYVRDIYQKVILEFSINYFREFLLKFKNFQTIYITPQNNCSQSFMLLLLSEGRSIISESDRFLQTVRNCQEIRFDSES